MTKLKKILKYLLIVTVLLVMAIIFPIFSYKKEANPNPLPEAYKKGVYHMHSIYSDGKGTVDEITRAAADAGLDFAILTDHGRPNRKSSLATAYDNGVLLIGGSEFSTHAGHLASVGYRLPGYIFPPEPQEAIDEVNADKGVSFISHPHDDKIPWTDWTVKGFTGLEVVSCYSSARKTAFLKLLAFPMRYWLKANYALVSTLKYPEKNLAKWDGLNARALETGTGYYGIYALDAHAKLPITETFQLNFPTYASMFEILRIYVKTEGRFGKDAHTDAAAIVAALRKGNFFNVIEALGSANGFDAWFTTGDGQRLDMGGTAPLLKSGRATLREGALTVLLPFGFETDVVVVRNGKIHERIDHNREDRLDIAISEPGVYRLEVFITENMFSDLPWIMTNPFFIAATGSLPATGAATGGLIVDEAAAQQLPPPGGETDFFRVEKNDASLGTMTVERPEEGAPVTRLIFKLNKDKGKKDFWSVLAVRKRFDFSRYTGLTWRARSDKKRRFWVEYRTGEGANENWRRHSFLVGPEWKHYRLPFGKFYHIAGGDEKRNMTDVTSLFFSINNANAHQGTEGRFEVKEFGAY